MSTCRRRSCDSSREFFDLGRTVVIQASGIPEKET